MGLLQDISYYWKQLDPRVVDLPLVGSSYQVLFLTIAYLYFVTSYGPQFMKNRSPYSLKTFIKLYNIVQIFGNIWVVYDAIDAGVFTLKLVCPVIDYSNDYIPMRVVRCFWYYFLLKILDYIETVVFILRKKDNQVSTLHLYHHVSTLLFTWICLRYFAILPALVLCVINSFTHVVMYMYYFLAAWGPNVQKIVTPMKPWITIIQMIQLIVLFLYSAQGVLLNCNLISTTGNSISFTYSCLPLTYSVNVLINFYMFYNFYQKTYGKHKKTQ